MSQSRKQSVISARLLKSLVLREKPYEVRDARLTGFLVRVQPSGYKYFVVEWGRGKRNSIGKVGVFTPAQARDLARDVAQMR